MGRLRSLASSAVVRVAASTPISFARNLEQVALLAQGTGWGTATLAQEVRAGLSLLPDSRRTAPRVFDIGANVGEWALALLRAAPEASVTCFEPSPVAFTGLKERLAYRNNVEAIQVAVGRTSGRASLWADSPGSGLASLTQRRLDHLGMGFSHCETVEVTSLDEWIGQRGDPAPDLIKLDIEGHEMDALLGGSETVSQTGVVQFEFGGCNIDTRTYFRDFYLYFVESGFEIFRLAPRGLIPISRYRELDEVFITTNFFARSRR